MHSVCARNDPGFAGGRAALVVVFLVQDSDLRGGCRDEHFDGMCD